MTNIPKSSLHARALCVQLSLLAGCAADDSLPEPANSHVDIAPPGVTTPTNAQAVETRSTGKTAESAAAAATDGAPAPQNADATPGMNAVPGAGAAMAQPAAAHVEYPDLRGGCGDINSGYADDHACIPAPAPGEGLQIHIGPNDYSNSEEVAKFIIHPGEESSMCWTYRTSNEEDVYYQSYVLSGRAGTHHILGSMLAGERETDAGFSRCADTREGADGGVENLGPMPMATKPYMPRGQVAPENAHIAHLLPAHALAEADMHYYNYTDHDIIREIWLNLYFAPREQITGEMVRVRGMGGFGWSKTPIEPGTDTVYQYECPITGNGRILSLLGHYHAHGKRFTASLKRKSGSVEKIFEMFNYQEPAGFEYDSVTANPLFSTDSPGATSGILNVEEGDVLAWECHIVNDSNVGLRYTNEVNTGEMCNLWGQSFGIDKWDCLKN
jgi:hypothetical protein